MSVILIETRKIENGVTALIYGVRDGFLVVAEGSVAIPFRVTKRFDVLGRDLDEYVRKVFNLSRQFSHRDDEDNRNAALEAL